jgi:hypothetical protein
MDKKTKDITTIDEHIKDFKKESWCFLKTWNKLTPNQKNDIVVCMQSLIEKEKKKRDIEIKNAFIAGAECGEMFNNENRCFTTDAEQYLNELKKNNLKE